MKSLKHKQYVVITLATTLLVITMNVATLEWFMRSVLLEQTHFHITYDRLNDEIIKGIEVVAIGDSHPMNDLNMDTDAFLNMGMGSETILQSYYKYKYYLEKGMRPKLVLLQADDYIFSSYRGDNLNMDKYARFINNEDLKEIRRFIMLPDIKSDNINSFLYQLRPEYAAKLHSTFIKYVKQGFRIESSSYVTSNGSVLHKGKWSDKNQQERDTRALERVQKHMPSSDKMQISYLSTYYEKFITLAKEKGAKIILVKYPLTPEYRLAIISQKIIKVEKYINWLKDKHNLTILSYKNWSDDNSLFVNMDHLNMEGAKKFTNVLMQDAGYL